MPALANPRWERFAQCIANGLTDANGKPNGKSTGKAAYLSVYPTVSDGNVAEAAASRLLRKVRPVIDRVRELQAEQNQRLQRKADYSKDRVASRLDLASRMAESQEDPKAIALNEMGIAKLFGHISATEQANGQDLRQAKSMNDIGRRLLISVGLAEPTELDVAAAVEANNAFVARLEAIRDQAQATVDAI